MWSVFYINITSAVQSSRTFKNNSILSGQGVIKFRTSLSVRPNACPFYLQVIKWMQNPTELSALRDFQDWKETCDEKGQPYCSLPNACPLTTRELPGETLRLFTCMECPNYYPWLLDPTGDGFTANKWTNREWKWKKSSDRLACVFERW